MLMALLDPSIRAKFSLYLPLMVLEGRVTSLGVY